MDFCRHITGFLAFLLLVSWNAAAQGTVSGQRGRARNDLFIDAVQDINDGRTKEASAKLSALTERYPEEDAYWYYAGINSLSMRQFKKAAEYLRKAVALDSTNYWYRERLAYAYSAAGETDLTVSTYEDILRDFPRKSDAWYSLVNLYLYQKDYEKVLSAMDQIEASSGKSETIAVTRYDILRGLGREEEAVAALKDYDKEFSSPRVLTMLADHEISQYRDTSAIAYYDEALLLESDFTPALLGKAEVFRMRRDDNGYFGVLKDFFGSETVPAASKGQYLSSALQHMDPVFIQKNRSRMDTLVEDCLLLHPSDSIILQSAGVYYFRTGRNARARHAMRKNMLDHPGSKGAAAGYVELLNYEKDWDAMAAVCDSACAAFPGETAFIDMKNVALYQKKDYKGILEGCRQIMEIAGADTSRTIPAMSTMGDMYHELGDDKSASKCYEAVLKLNPDYAPVLNNYAYYLSLQGKSLKKAAQMSRRTVEKEPDNPTYLDTYAWILHLMGKDAEAKPLFKHAMLYGGKESSVVLKHYSIVLEALGETDLAKVYSKMAQDKEKEGK